MGQKIRERQAEWEVRKSGRQLSRLLETCSKQSGIAAGSPDRSRMQDAGRLEFERAVQHPDLC